MITLRRHYGTPLLILLLLLLCSFMGLVLSEEIHESDNSTPDYLSFIPQCGRKCLREQAPRNIPTCQLDNRECICNGGHRSELVQLLYQCVGMSGDCGAGQKSVTSPMIEQVCDPNLSASTTSGSKTSISSTSTSTNPTLSSPPQKATEVVTTITSTRTSPTATPVRFIDQSNAPKPISKRSLSKGAVAGITVGSIIFIATLAVLCFIFAAIRRRRQRHRHGDKVRSLVLEPTLSHSEECGETEWKPGHRHGGAGVGSNAGWTSIASSSVDGYSFTSQDGYYSSNSNMYTTRLAPLNTAASNIVLSEKAMNSLDAVVSPVSPLMPGNSHHMHYDHGDFGITDHSRQQFTQPRVLLASQRIMDHNSPLLNTAPTTTSAPPAPPGAMLSRSGPAYTQTTSVGKYAHDDNDDNDEDLQIMSPVSPVSDRGLVFVEEHTRSSASAAGCSVVSYDRDSGASMVPGPAHATEGNAAVRREFEGASGSPPRPPVGSAAYHRHTCSHAATMTSAQQASGSPPTTSSPPPPEYDSPPGPVISRPRADSAVGGGGGSTVDRQNSLAWRRGVDEAAERAMSRVVQSEQMIGSASNHRRSRGSGGPGLAERIARRLSSQKEEEEGGFGGGEREREGFWKAFGKGNKGRSGSKGSTKSRDGEGTIV